MGLPLPRLPPRRSSQPSHSSQMHVSKGFAASPLGRQHEQGPNQTPGPQLILRGLPAQEVAAPSFSGSDHNPGKAAECARTQGEEGRWLEHDPGSGRGGVEMRQKGATASQTGPRLILRDRGRPEQSNMWRPLCRVRHSRQMVKRKTVAKAYICCCC